MPETIGEVVIDHADRFHKGIDDGGADKIEPASFQLFGNGL